MKQDKWIAFKQIAYVCLPLLVFVVLYDVWAALLSYLGTLGFTMVGERALSWLFNHMETFQALCIMGGLALSFLCLYKLARTDGFLTPKKESWRIPIRQYVLLGLLTAGFAVLCNVLFYVTGFMEVSESYQAVAKNQHSVPLFVGILLYGVVSPFVEEVVFRGFLYGRMRVYMKWYGAMLISALLFGIYHGNIVQGVYGFLMGVLITLVYHKYKNFYFTFFMHAIINLVALLFQL